MWPCPYSRLSVLGLDFRGLAFGTDSSSKVVIRVAVVVPLISVSVAVAVPIPIPIVIPVAVAVAIAIAVAVIIVVTVAVAVVVAVTIAISHIAHRKLGAVILGSALSNRHQHRLMVSSTGEGTKPVKPCRQPPRHVGTQQPRPVAFVVDPLEEDKPGRIEGLAGTESPAHVLDRHMCVTFDDAADKRLGRRVVRFCRVREPARNQIRDPDLDLEVGVWIDIFAWLWPDDDARHHLRLRRNFTHHYGAHAERTSMLDLCFWPATFDNEITNDWEKNSKTWGMV